MNKHFKKAMRLSKAMPSRKLKKRTARTILKHILRGLK